MADIERSRKSKNASKDLIADREIDPSGRPAGEKMLLLASIAKSLEDALITNDINDIASSWNPGAERITELRHANQELEDTIEKLRAEIKEHEQIEKDLIEAEKAAQALALSRSNFMSDMSHEIRTPMNSIIGMTSLLLDDENMTSEQKDFIETIRVSGDTLMVVINDILDFSKMESEKLGLEEQPFKLRILVEESLGMVAVDAAKKRLDLAYTVNRNVPKIIIGDPTRLRQVLCNLLSNAVKFTESGYVRLHISSRKIEGAQEIHFAVQDTGIGIPLDFIDKLFQPFSQSDSSIARKYGGTGLGLAISKKLVELMKGEIWVESKERSGSTFHFTIKTTAAPSKSSRAASRSSAPAHGQ